jgi:preprotein translocase subunit SecE
MVLHVSKASLASPPWVEVDLPPDVHPSLSALGSPVHVKANLPGTRQTVETSQIVLAYILVLAPFLGLIAGIYLLTKNEVGHGIAVIIISLFLFLFFLGLQLM